MIINIGERIYAQNPLDDSPLRSIVFLIVNVRFTIDDSVAGQGTAFPSRKTDYYQDQGMKHRHTMINECDIIST
jgi:hypothetical protein